MPIAPAAMIDPNRILAPSGPGFPSAMATIGPTAAKVTPIMTGILMPNHWVAPKDWMMVTRPQQNRSAEIRKATSCGVRFKARPTMSGTAIAPAYMTRTCCIPSAARRGSGNTSSTGWTVDDMVFSRSKPAASSKFLAAGCFRMTVFAPPHYLRSSLK